MDKKYNSSGDGRVHSRRTGWLLGRVRWTRRAVWPARKGMGRRDAKSHSSTELPARASNSHSWVRCCSGESHPPPLLPTRLFSRSSVILCVTQVSNDDNWAEKCWQETLTHHHLATRSYSWFWPSLYSLGRNSLLAAFVRLARHTDSHMHDGA